MNQTTKDYVNKKVNELISAHSCCAEAKEAGKNWLKAVGTEKEADMTKRLIEELEADIMPIDQLIAFTASEAGAALFGAEMAKNIHDHGQEIKAAGAKYCDCPACAAAAAILEKKEELMQ